MLTLENAQVDKFPLKKGDRVKITWAAPKGMTDHGVIHELKTGMQWGKHVVYAIMVLIDGQENPCVVCFDCLSKTT